MNGEPASAGSGAVAWTLSYAPSTYLENIEQTARQAKQIIFSLGFVLDARRIFAGCSDIETLRGMGFRCGGTNSEKCSTYLRRSSHNTQMTYWGRKWHMTCWLQKV